LIDLETHEAVFTWTLQRLADAGLVKGKTVGIDATTLEANAALRSIVRRDTGESYQDFLTKLAPARPIAADGTGRRTPRRATRCIAIVGAFAVNGACACCGSVASAWNGPLPISMRPAASAACSSAATPTFGSDC
jgi:hypothetical protein